MGDLKIQLNPKGNTVQDLLSLQATKALLGMQAQTSALGSHLALLRT